MFTVYAFYAVCSDECVYSPLKTENMFSECVEGKKQPKSFSTTIHQNRRIYKEHFGGRGWLGPYRSDVSYTSHLLCFPTGTSHLVMYRLEVFPHGSVTFLLCLDYASLRQYQVFPQIQHISCVLSSGLPSLCSKEFHPHRALSELL